MSKVSVLLLFFLFLGSIEPSRAQLLSYEDFAHLPKERQDEFVIKIMELAAELEANYVHETRTSGFTEKRLKLYVQTLKEFYQILGPLDAHADDDPNDWSTVMTHMARAQQQKDLCLYAGWISHTFINEEGNTRCRHPAYTKNFKSGYPSENPNFLTSRLGSCPERNSVQCNPVIFGYKDIRTQKLFCVRIADNAQNSSYQCMKEALKEPGKKDRLAYLRSKLLQKGNYQTTRNLIYKSCLCSNNSQFDEAYTHSVRTRLTCYSILEMMRQTSYEECSKQIVLPQESEQFFKSMKGHMQRFRNTTDQALLDKEYTSFVEQEFSSPSMKKELAQVCAGTKKTFDCQKVVCEKSEEEKKSKINCDFFVFKDGKRVSFKPTGLLPKENHKGSFSINGEVENQKFPLVCPTVTFKDKEKEATIQVAATIEPVGPPAPIKESPPPSAPAAATTPAVVQTPASVPTPAEVSKPVEPAPSAPASTNSCEASCEDHLWNPTLMTCTINLKFNQKEVTRKTDYPKDQVEIFDSLPPSRPVRCEIKKRPKASEKAPTCTVKCGPPPEKTTDAKASECTAEMTDSKGEKKTLPSPQGLPTLGTETNVEITSEDKKYTCQVEWQKAEEKPSEETSRVEEPSEGTTSSEERKTPELILAKSETPKSATIKAEIKNGEGWTLIWSIKGTDKPVEKSWEKVKPPSELSSAVVQDESISTDKKDSAPVLEITQARYAYKYSVCGKLTKGTESTIEKCEEISAIDSPKPNYSPLTAPPPMPPQTPMRQSSDTSAMGIK